MVTLSHISYKKGGYMAKLGQWTGIALLALACGDEDKDPETGVEQIKPGQSAQDKLVIGLGGQRDLDAL
ncbi:MAG: hypothetical protein ABI895_23230 [Deltaproteobacteria bacterium]